MKVGEGENDFGIILGVSRVVMEEEVAKKNELLSFLGSELLNVSCSFTFELEAL